MCPPRRSHGNGSAASHFPTLHHQLPPLLLLGAGGGTTLGKGKGLFYQPGMARVARRTLKAGGGGLELLTPKGGGVVGSLLQSVAGGDGAQLGSCTRLGRSLPGRDPWGAGPGGCQPPALSCELWEGVFVP